MENFIASLVIPESAAGQRLDQALAQLVPEHSRARLQDWIKNGHVLVNGHIKKPKEKVLGAEQIDIDAPLPQEVDWIPEAIALNIIFEDNDILVINKPVGLVVHPGAGNTHSTLSNAVLAHAPATAQVPRAGIVHRIDKDTSGLLVIAKTLEAHTALVHAIQEREVKREYICLANGTFTSGGTIDAPIARHPKQRKQMAIVDTGKPAVTHYRIRERFIAHTLLDVQLETGRTHQIRVHMQSIRHPLVGDKVYGGRPKFPKGASDSLRQALSAFSHQALHAAKLTFAHPRSHETLTFSAPLPDDFSALCEQLREG